MGGCRREILQFLPKSSITGLEDGVDTSYAAQLQMTPQQAIPSFIVTEVPVEELELENATVPIESQVSNMGDSSSSFVSTNDADDDSLLIRSRGKRKAKPSSCDDSYGYTQRLIEIEEEKLAIKKRRLEVEEEKLKVMNNCFNFLQSLFSTS
ncbi:uncharacterized protein LOC111108933 isoform X3 [Crassostrea virginica]|uniref:Uncharacterized protein LOC111101556 n=1 Tax=Crassostrea virginica TaxID=6565 RepID=A0A8B8AEG0_CRAVI|nr:uncharacterized protein LOC111101556 [Crassostrea virginica]